MSCKRISLYIRNVIILSGLVLLLPSCTEVQCGGSKANFQNQFDNFLEKVDELEYDLDSKKWKPFDDRFRLFVEECYPHYEDEMSRAEKSRFWMKTLEFYSDRYGNEMADAFADHGELISEEVVENLEEVLEETGRKLEDFLEKNGDELESLFDQVGKDIESWAEKLQEILEDN